MERTYFPMFMGDLQYLFVTPHWKCTIEYYSIVYFLERKANSKVFRRDLEFQGTIKKFPYQLFFPNLAMIFQKVLKRPTKKYICKTSNRNLKSQNFMLSANLQGKKQRKFNQKASDTMYLHKQNQEILNFCSLFCQYFAYKYVSVFPAHLNTSQISAFLNTYFEFFQKTLRNPYTNFF